MKVLKSVLLTVVIVGSVWSAVWAQNMIKPTGQLIDQPDVETKQLAEFKKPFESAKQSSLSKTGQHLPKTLVGLSRSSTFVKAESTANALMVELVQTPSLFTSFKEGDKLNFYLVYKLISQNELLISCGVSNEDLKVAGLQTLAVPQGKYQKLAGVSDGVDIEDAWQQLDLKRELQAVVEIYQLNQLGAVISARSFVAYKR